MLKNILLRILKQGIRTHVLFYGQILGENFSSDEEVYKEMKTINPGLVDGGKIIALCYGWPNDRILVEIFEKFNQGQYEVVPKVAYNLKFLFCDVENILLFFKEVLVNHNLAKHEYNYFIEPLYRRIFKDEKLQAEIKNKLLNSSLSNSEKISYYAVLDSINKIDDDVSKWKGNQISEDLIEGYGYNIMTNTTSLTSEIIQESYF